MIKGLVSDSMRQNFLRPYWRYDVEAERYPIIHELSLHRVQLDRTYAELQEKLQAYQQFAKDHEAGASDPASSKKLKEQVKEIQELLTKYEGHFSALKKQALEDGKGKAISREAALDIVFRLYRAYESTTPTTGGDPRSDSGVRFLHDVQKRSLPSSETSTGFKFGVAVVDFNVTGPNSVDRVLGDLVLDETYQTLKESFPDSSVTRGTRTNFRIVNPDGGLLSQEKLLDLEKRIYDRIVKKAGPQPPRKWKKFLDGYQINLSAGYEEVRFQADEVQKGPTGEYKLESIVDLLDRVDQAFRTAGARSQEVASRLKDTTLIQESSKVPRLNHGQFPILDPNGLPEGRFFEPLEKQTPGTEAIRIVHNLKRTFENIATLRTAVNHMEYLLTEGSSNATARVTARAELNKGLGLLKENQEQFSQIYFDVSHDLRLPRMVDRKFSAERVDAIVRETGGARLLFIELGQFYSFVRTWFGGAKDEYVHGLILDFYKILQRKGLSLVHPSNEAPLVADGHLAVDPRSGGYFTKLPKTGSVPPIAFLTNPRSGAPVARELIVGLREGDEIGFVIGERDARGRYVSDKTVKEVFRQFNELIESKYGTMQFDDIVKVGPDKIRKPQWQMLSYRTRVQKGIINGSYVIDKNAVPRTETEITRDFTGIVQDYVTVTKADVQQGVPREEAKVVIARRPRWRFFEDGKLSPNVEIHIGDTIFPNDNKTVNAQAVPEEWVNSYPQIHGKPMLVKMQKPLSAGYVAVDLRRGTDLEEAWNKANNLSKKSKDKKEPILIDLKTLLAAKPPVHDYDKAISTDRTAELEKQYALYVEEGALKDAPKLSAELRGFLKDYRAKFDLYLNPQAPKVFEQGIESLIRDRVDDPAKSERLIKELKAHVAGHGELIQLRDALLVVQTLEREGLSLELKKLAPSFWQALKRGQEIFGINGVTARMGRARTQLVKQYVQQTGSLPPPDILAEAREYVDPLSVFIPEEVYSLARRHKIAPEKVPYFVAGLKAEEIRKLGKEAFTNLTYEDLSRLAESREGQDFLRDPKNALLIRDTLGSRAVYQGVPLAAAMLSVFPAEMLGGYLANKIGQKAGLSPARIQEIKFGITLYLAHSMNITASGVWEVAVNRMGAAKALSQMIGEKVNLGILRSAKLAGQPILQVGLSSGGNGLRALADGVLEKWGITNFSRMGVSGLAWHGLKSIPQVPWQMLKTMGPGYLASRVFDRTMGIWLDPNHPIRKYGSFVSFFLPDILRMSIGSARIAANPVLSRAGNFFTKAGNRMLLIAISDFAFGKLFSGSDYERSIQKRVADKVYDQDVYKLNKWDLLLVPAALKLVRAGARELAPNAIDWSLSVDNPDLKQKVIDEDLKNSRDITAFLKEGYARLLLNPGSFDVTDPNSYKAIDFSMLSQPVVLNEQEKRLLKSLHDCNQLEGDKDLHLLPEAEMEKSLQRVYLFQLQQGVKFLQAVKQTENLWAEGLFKPDGTLVDGAGDRLLRIAVPSKQGEPSSAQKLLTSRRILIAMNYLDGQSQFQGEDIGKLSKAAGIIDGRGKLVLDNDMIGALALFAEQAKAEDAGALKEKLAQRSGELMSEYLTADETRKKQILLALNSMGVSSPGTVPEVSQ